MFGWVELPFSVLFCVFVFLSPDKSRGNLGQRMSWRTSRQGCGTDWPPSLSSPLTAQRIDDDASVHDQLLWAIHLSGLDDLLLFLASSPTEQQWSLHVLEIISLMFRDQVRPWPVAPVPLSMYSSAMRPELLL